MALDFPATPTAGQTFTSGGVTWLYDGIKWIPSNVNRPSPISFPIQFKPPASSKLNCTMPWKILVPANLAGSVGIATTSATASSVFTVNKVSGGVTTALGTVTFAAGVANPTFAGAGGSLAVGDTLQIIAPSTQDNTLADISLTIWTLLQ